MSAMERNSGKCIRTPAVSAAAPDQNAQGRWNSTPLMREGMAITTTLHARSIASSCYRRGCDTLSGVKQHRNALWTVSSSVLAALAFVAVVYSSVGAQQAPGAPGAQAP